jgi:glycosyltransferase involved in cell wall biosynthesis
LSNLFDGWPKNSLAQVCYNIGQPDFDVCTRFWRLTKPSVIKACFGFTGNFPLKPLDNQGGQSASKGIVVNSYDSRSAIERLLGKSAASVRVPIGEVLLRLPASLSLSLVKWIEDFSPDAVFSTLGNGLMLQLVCRIAKQRRLPIIPYFTDDWIETHYEGVLFRRLLRKSMQFWMGRCLECSQVRMVVSRAMENEYRNRYSGEFVTMKYAVKATRFYALEERSNNEPIKIVYTGGLVPGRCQPLRDIVDALVQINRDGVRANLSIYTDPASIRQHAKDLDFSPVITVHEWIPYEELQSVFRETDVLLHVESFDSTFSAWTRYSISTKIADYLMSGRCLFAYGPAEGAALCSIQESGSGVVVTERDQGILQKKLKEILLNHSAREAYGKRARETAILDHEAIGQAEKFRQLVCQAVDSDEQGKQRLDG